MGGMGLIFTPVLVRHLLGPLGLSGPMTSTSRIHTDTLNGPITRYNLPLDSHSLHPLYYPPLHSCMQFVILQ